MPQVFVNITIRKHYAGALIGTIFLLSFEAPGIFLFLINGCISDSRVYIGQPFFLWQIATYNGCNHLSHYLRQQMLGISQAIHLLLGKSYQAMATRQKPLRALQVELSTVSGKEKAHPYM